MALAQATFQRAGSNSGRSLIRMRLESRGRISTRYSTGSISSSRQLEPENLCKNLRALAQGRPPIDLSRQKSGPRIGRGSIPDASPLTALLPKLRPLRLSRLRRSQASQAAGMILENQSRKLAKSGNYKITLNIFSLVPDPGVSGESGSQFGRW